MDQASISPPATVVIFGASGDLTQRKLVPALHSLACWGRLSPAIQVLGVARSALSDEAFRARLYEGVERHARLKPGRDVCQLWSNSEDNYAYLAGSYDDPETYRRLGQRLAQLDAECGTQGNVLFYLATPPSLYEEIIYQLGEAGLGHGADSWQHVAPWRRIIVEKPFGHDMQSALNLDTHLHAVFDESQVYRIDHYLGKETVQNVLTLRFANAIFDRLWSREHIDHVQITVAEAVGVEHRAGYYDQTGVLRDMFQNHLLQLLALTAMEPPDALSADNLRHKKVELLEAVRIADGGVCAQYRGYRDEPGVAASSQTPTYAALQLFVDNDRWRGVPFYLRSGKALAGKVTEIALHVKPVPHTLFQSTGEPVPQNILSLCIQPDQGVHLQFGAKIPGAGMHTYAANLKYHYVDDALRLSSSTLPRAYVERLGDDDLEQTHSQLLPEAYERLLLDALQGDASLFALDEEINLSWKLIDPIIERWARRDAPPLLTYEPGSWGPPEADDFLAKDGRAWYHGCGAH